MHSGRALRAVCPSVEVVEHFFVTALSPRDAVSAGDGSQEDSGTASSIRMRSRQLAPSTGGGAWAGREAIEGIESTTLEPRYTVQEKTVPTG